MTIKINNQIVKAEILPSNTPTLDETLETFSFALVSSDSALPYAPMQNVDVTFAEGDEGHFYLVSDSVETYSLKPLRYKHSITCIQNSRKLSKYIVRNSVFTQPGFSKLSSFNAESSYNDSYGTGYSYYDWGGLVPWTQPNIPSLNWASEKLTLNREKISKATFKISFQYLVDEGQSEVADEHAFDRTIYSNSHTANEIKAKSPIFKYVAFANQLNLKCTDPQGNEHIEPIYPSYFGLSEFRVNETYNYPRIKNLADQGYNNFEILFTRSDFLTARYIDDQPSDFVNELVFWACQVEIDAEVYYYNCYDILQLLLNRQKRETSIREDNPLFVLPEDSDSYTQNQRELANLLNNTIAPNFTFTQLTMYECVAEVFRLFDAIFNMDENDVLGIEYFNDLSGEVVNSNNKFTGRTLAWGEDKYTNGLISHYQDARISESFPKEKGEFAHLRSEEFGVPEAQDHHFIVPHDIQKVEKCEVSINSWKLNAAGLSTVWVVVGDFGLDITRYVVEQTIWSSLAVGDMTSNDYRNRVVKQANTIYYAQGDNKIQCAYSFKTSWNLTRFSLLLAIQSALTRLIGTVGGDCTPPSYANNWYQYTMRATYITTVDGRIQVHSLSNKYDGETLIDQNNGAVDLNKMGLNMLGLSLKLGNPTLNATHKITRWADRIKIGQIYEYTAKDPVTNTEKTSLWIANVVNYTFFGGYIQGKVSFVQNFNQLALRTRLLREKRMSNISRELTQKSEDIITDFIYFSSISLPVSYGHRIHFNYQMTFSFLRDSFDINGPYKKIKDAFIYKSSDVDMNDEVDAIYIPLICYGAGNTVNFEMSLNHPMNAGNQTLVEFKAHPHEDEVKQYFTNHVIYTDADGFMDEISIYIPLDTQQVTYTTTFPKTHIYVNESDETDGIIKLTSYKVYKQPNEIFALNYQLAFLPHPGRENIDFIGNEWINSNCFVKNIEELSQKRYIVFKSQKSSNLDIKATPYFAKKEITNVVADYPTQNNNYRYRLEFDFTALTQEEQGENQIVSWAIVDDRDNVLFASNNTSILSDRVYIYFATETNRLN